jgi:hypothetical protein
MRGHKKCARAFIVRSLRSPRGSGTLIHRPTTAARGVVQTITFCHFFSPIVFFLNCHVKLDIYFEDTLNHLTTELGVGAKNPPFPTQKQ